MGGAGDALRTARRAISSGASHRISTSRRQLAHCRPAGGPCAVRVAGQPEDMHRAIGPDHLDANSWRVPTPFTGQFTQARSSELRAIRRSGVGGHPFGSGMAGFLPVGSSRRSRLGCIRTGVRMHPRGQRWPRCLRAGQSCVLRVSSSQSNMRCSRRERAIGSQCMSAPSALVNGTSTLGPGRAS